MKRKSGIMCYGTSEDREKLQKLAEKLGTTGSTLLLLFIRQKYAEVFGDE